MNPNLRALDTTYRFTMTKKDALSLGLLTCECGHPENNHFQHSGTCCARCECKRFTEVPIVGKLERVE